MRAGAEVVILDLNETRVKAIAREAGDGTAAVRGDVARQADIEAAMKRCLDEF